MIYRKGDVVVLRSGGPTMTVVATENKDVTCVYFSPFREIMRSWQGPIEAIAPVDGATADEEDE
jgi:Uncharacterized small protein (DUF2158)